MSIPNRTNSEPPKNNQSINGSSTETLDADWKGIYRIGGVAALMQFTCTLIIIIVTSTLGLKPISAHEYFTLLESNKIVGLLRDDFLSLIIIALYLLTFFALYGALRRDNCVYAALATVLTFVAVTCSFASHSGFSIVHLSEQYAAASTDAVRSQLLAAGEAIIASDMWNSTAGFMAGILLQGAGVLISVVMLRGRTFSKVTAYAGILANGFDLAQHLIHPLLRSIASILLMIAGPFYLLWFPLLSRDLFKLGRLEKKVTVEKQRATLP
ncbi:hypothetical protein CEE34_06415 [Candidatus Aerophobetes bacterium Ae_b3a]|nr:MAG: hypothetical protein CEE34_06415 [Candidatus Aerophobetes bacterium Ae_b3a]